MILTFEFTAKCQVTDATAKPSTDQLREYLEECLKDQMNIDSEITILTYSECNFRR